MLVPLKPLRAALRVAPRDGFTSIRNVVIERLSGEPRADLGPCRVVATDGSLLLVHTWTEPKTDPPRWALNKVQSKDPIRWVLPAAGLENAISGLPGATRWIEVLQVARKPTQVRVRRCDGLETLILQEAKFPNWSHLIDLETTFVDCALGTKALRKTMEALSTPHGKESNLLIPVVRAPDKPLTFVALPDPADGILSHSVAILMPRSESVPLPEGPAALRQVAQKVKGDEPEA